MKNIFTPYIQKGKELLHRGARGGDVAPKRDWYIILSGTVVFMLGFVSVGVYAYHVAVRATTAVSVLLESEDVGSDGKTLGRVLGAYRARVADFDTLRVTPEPAPVLGGGDALMSDMVLEAPTMGASTTPATIIGVEEESDPAIRVES